MRSACRTERRGSHSHAIYEPPAGRLVSQAGLEGATARATPSSPRMRSPRAAARAHMAGSRRRGRWPAASRTTDSCGRGMGRGPTPRPPTCWSQNGWSVKKGTTTVAPRPTTRCGWCQHRRDGRPRPYEETASRAGPGRPPGPRRRGQRWPAGRPSPATASPGSRPGRSAATVSWASATASRSVMLPKPT
jgi:hypothetical protein